MTRRRQRREAPSFDVNLPDFDREGSIDFDEGIEEPRESALLDSIRKRAGARHKSAGIDFDEGLGVVDLRKADAPAKAPEPPSEPKIPKLAQGTVIQTLIMDKGKFPDAAAAKKWAKDHGFRADKVDETENSFRLRQADPAGFSMLRTITLTDGVKATVGLKKTAKSATDESMNQTKFPAMLTWLAVRKGALQIGEDGSIVSGLPPSLERDVPPEFRWWKCASQDDALRVRAALVESQLFTPETVLVVNGEQRRVITELVAKRYLPPEYPGDVDPVVPPMIRPVEKAAALLVESDSEISTTLFDQDVVDAVGLDAIMSKVDQLRGDWVVCAKDSAENRKVIGGPAFRLLSREDLIFATNAELDTDAPVEWVTDTRPGEVIKFAFHEGRSIRLVKANEERIVYGVVLEPDEVDTQGDTISPEEIRQAAHKFMSDYGNLGLQHNEIVNGKLKLLESFIAPTGFDINGQTVKAGTWLMAERVVDDQLWESVKKGELTGFSIGGSAIRKPKTKGKP